MKPVSKHVSCSVLVLSLIAFPRLARACDLCAVYASLQAKESAHGWYVGLHEQLTHFATVRDDGHEVANSAHQRLDSSITQAFVGYEFAPTVGVQANVPFVNRSFRRPQGDAITSGHTRGLGDAAVLVRWRPWLSIAAERIATLTVLGGVKLPTGDSDRIREELREDDEEGNGVRSGIHGHDIALGTGSTDAILGLSGFYRDRRVFANATLQYTARRRGDFDYRYGNDFAWSLAPGYYLDLTHENTLAAGVVLSGEHKSEDDLAGLRADDTAIDALYLGPQVTFSRGSELYGEAAFDLPLRQHNSGFQAVPSYRLRIAITWRP